MNTTTLEKFKHYFSPIDFNNISILEEIYSEDIVFKDPIHEIDGIENLKAYFQKLNENLIEGTFHFTDESIMGNKAYLSWEMNLKLKRPKKNVKASGISVLIFENEIISQRDYFDAGELFYENIPILGSIIRSIKKKL
ncbi:nuclear transport factor 2 family protein [Marivirga harenae]|uniref:nuclear transport factor 2 family protein n=1 Tax=Marivirga harenae TaxID=2010992 RepID=UPI0026DEAFC6|nr:nuclear transport factor 2 family protein [Marivirga harenae]WKV13015.1 nuclear transport factor 2 family protein [Marivirga harenae]|tara:strand:+ start:142634 stop:143047 length:414 start_codon:yes stop_codon:yes gene_type:complete